MSKELLNFMTWVNQDEKLGYTSIGIERIVNRYITSKDLIIDDSYRFFKNSFPMKKSNPPKDYINEKGQLLTQEEFINKCKTDTEFSEKWGLKIEERELSLEERAKWLQDNKGYDLLVGNLDHDHIREVVEEEAPTKLITITYNDKTIESYE